MTIDWTQFREGDRVRVTFEGVWRKSIYDYLATNGHNHLQIDGTLRGATSAELIERPFVAPRAGKLFRSKGCLWMSMGNDRFTLLRDIEGKPVEDDSMRRWDRASQEWRDSIEVLDA